MEHENLIRSPGTSEAEFKVGFSGMNTMAYDGTLALVGLFIFHGIGTALDRVGEEAA